MAAFLDSFATAADIEQSLVAELQGESLHPSFVSVVMPVWNEADFIARSLGAVIAQDYPADRIEVLIADGGSTDGTRSVIEGLQTRLGRIHIHLLDNPARTTAAGLNTALTRSRGEVIVRVDGHTEVASDYVRQCVALLASSSADNVGGRMVSVGRGMFGRAVALATSSRFGIGGGRFHFSHRQEWVDTVFLGAWPREVFERIGLFDEEMDCNEDDEHNCRLREKGGRIMLSPSIRSTYINRNSPRALWQQYRRYGFWKVRVLQKHPRQMAWRQFAPPIFVGLTLLAAGLALLSPVGRLGLAAIVGSYLLANTAASVWNGRRAGAAVASLLPLAYVTLHVGYGVGFLAGLVRFSTTWQRPSTIRPPGLSSSRD